MRDNVRKYHTARQLVAAEVADEIRQHVARGFMEARGTAGVYTLSWRQSMPFNFPDHAASLKQSLERRLSRELDRPVVAQFAFRRILPPRIKISHTPR